MAIKFDLPLQVIEHTESLEIRDAKGRRLSHTYFEDEQSRRDQMNRLTSEEAWAFVRWILLASDKVRRPDEPTLP